MDSLVCNENINTEDFNERANRVEVYEETVNIIIEYKDIIKTNKKEHNTFLHINQVKFLENLRKIDNLKVLLND